MSISLKRPLDPAPTDSGDETTSEAGSETEKSKRAKTDSEKRLNATRTSLLGLHDRLNNLFNDALKEVMEYEGEHRTRFFVQCQETGDMIDVKDKVLDLLNLVEGGDWDSAHSEVIAHGEDVWRRGDYGDGRCSICQTSLSGSAQCTCSC